MLRQVLDVDAVVFDLYGTLLRIGERRSPYRSLMRLLAKAGRRPLPTDARTIMTTAGGLAAAVANLGAELPTAELAPLETHLLRELAEVRAYSDALPTLKALCTAVLRVGICSNLAGPYVVPSELLLPAFDARAYSCEVGWVKPEPEMYEHICARLELAPHRVLMVGDTLAADVAGPRQFGMHSVHLDRSGKHLGALSSLGELVTLIHKCA